MHDIQELSGLYKKQVSRLIEENIEGLTFYVKQEAFSHMTISAAFWHGDLYWNIWNKDGSKFEPHTRLSHDEFIVEDVYFNKDEATVKLRAIYDKWNQATADDDGEEDDEGEDLFSRLIRQSHEALAAAFHSDTVTQQLMTILVQNPNFEAAKFNQVIRVEDPDGQFEFNFLEQLA
ncbi:hypothetical protein [Shewanella fidelis]|uniref:DUF4303 domain-containing protein n=1 Tax=Shewanella fidelis TaxID=173509 RepID=A0AAW8NJ33_9GAMM|nr:hypothetical protein [Shewanella fidelis]MDR8523313.1 hypothetical protein [Shewanella fidelis]MDW4811361.1 hypothetical protein [Shewanella fidelis]MDW4815482.1 hypothetical protein [Shewanella fidelis]MDW4819572.1 hypothetical protein [Shewanella fidelis]MDW4824454.1 hypothetical protein [Shewanella fidelis]